MTDLSSVTITITDIRAAGICASGARRWFRDHGIDFAAFLKDGISAAELIERGDQMAQRVVDRKLERESNG